ncbi:MAG: hypothetical protein HC944_00760 [Nanoarchaeota archaeon]|nr:hypothetical protein [Nanoarchaeota archaeon]
MTKDKKKKEEKPKKSDLKSFLKKRAPIYLGIIGIFVLFIIPELTKSDLQSSFPDNLTAEQKQIVEILMSYNGPNEKGLSVMNAISEQIAAKYPDEKIYDNKKTKIDLNISREDDSTEDYKVILIFESYKGKMDYVWNVNADTKEIKAESSDAKNIIDIVNYYD